MKDRFASPGLSYGDLKIELFECFWNRFEPFRKKRDYLASHKDFVLQKLKEGAEKSSAVADRFLNKAREAMGLNYGEINV